LEAIEAAFRGQSKKILSNKNICFSEELIFKYFTILRKNELINTSFYTGIGTAIGYISGFVVNKVIAIYLGPSGVALVSQFQNFITISAAAATGGIQQGVVKYIAEVRTDEDKKGLILSTSLRITIIFALLIGLSILIFSEYISKQLFNSNDYKNVLIILGLTVGLFGLNQLLMSILNGAGEIKKLVAVKISSNLFGLFMTATCAYIYGITGALISLALSQSVIFFVSLLFVTKCDWFKRELFSKKYDVDYSLKLFKYSLMAVSSVLLTPILQIGIRNYIVLTLSITQAGYWDGLLKISIAYLGIITTTLSIYYLPKLSSLSNNSEIRIELLNGYKILTPILVLVLVMVYTSRDYMIILLYSTEFLEMSHLFAPQLVGDFFKIMSWMVSMLMVSKAKTTLFIGSQLIFSVITYYLSIILINNIGITGVVWAHAIVYFIYAVVMVIIFRKYLVKQ
jgi:polysaccharide transporter, PST family